MVEPIRVGEGLLDVLQFKVRVVAENVIWSHAVCNQIDSQRDSNSHPPEAGASAKDVFGKCDPVKRRRWHRL